MLLASGNIPVIIFLNFYRDNAHVLLSLNCVKFYPNFYVSVSITYIFLLLRNKVRMFSTSFAMSTCQATKEGANNGKKNMESSVPQH